MNLTSANRYAHEEERCPLVLFCNTSETRTVVLRVQSRAETWQPGSTELCLHLEPGTTAPVGCLWPTRDEESNALTWISLGSRTDDACHCVYVAFRDPELGVRLVAAWEASTENCSPFSARWERLGSLARTGLPWCTVARFAILEGAPAEHGAAGSLLSPVLAVWRATGACWSDLRPSSGTDSSENESPIEG